MFAVLLTFLKKIYKLQAKEMHKDEHVYIPSTYQNLGKYDR